MQEAKMKDTAVCPYFDLDEDACDVGCGYISSHDASMIIKFCSCQYDTCQKYRELTDRLVEQEPVLPVFKQPSPTIPAAHCNSIPVLGLLFRAFKPAEIWPTAPSMIMIASK